MSTSPRKRPRFCNRHLLIPHGEVFSTSSKAFLYLYKPSAQRSCFLRLSNLSRRKLQHRQESKKLCTKSLTLCSCCFQMAICRRLSVSKLQQNLGLFLGLHFAREAPIYWRIRTVMCSANRQYIGAITIVNGHRHYIALRRLTR